jgi:hypothetical protein
LPIGQVFLPFPAAFPYRGGIPGPGPPPDDGCPQWVAARRSTDERTATMATSITDHRSGKVQMRADQFRARSRARFGGQATIAPERTIASRRVLAGGSPSRSTIIAAGEHPDGFGNFVAWHPADESLALVLFLNAADANGVMVSGVTDGDRIDIVSATGVASFAEDIENEGVASAIGIVAAGASLGASVFGAPELAPLIGAAAEFAKDRYQERKVRTKRRDPFGEDPGTGHKARQEGGVIISLPAAGAAFYSGDGDHRDRWIKEPGTRDDAHRPDHVRNAFFLQRDRIRNQRRATSDGDIIVNPWDHVFEDNAGFYRLHVLLNRMDPPPPSPVD